MRFCSIVAATSLLAVSTASAQITITEVRTGPGRVPTGTTVPSNAEYIELKGPPGTSLAGHVLVVIGDGPTSGTTATKSGVVEWLYRFAATDTIGANGFLVLRNPGQNPFNAADTSGAFPFTVAAGATDLPWRTFTQADGTATAGQTQIENGDNQTFLLVTGYTGTDSFQTRAPEANGGSTGQDLDTNDDGVLDVAPWATVVDAMVLKASSGSAPVGNQVWWYAPTTCGPEPFRVLSTSGTPIAGWTMPTAVPSGQAGATYEYGQADSGSNAPTSMLKGVHAGSATVWSSPAGNASLHSLSSNTWAIGDYYEFSTSTVGFPAASIQWDQTRSSTGPATFRVDMSTDGTNFTTILNTYTVIQAGTSGTSSWSTGGTYQSAFTTKIENIPGAAGLPMVWFRLVATAAPTGSTPLAGTNRIDNVLVRFGSTPTAVTTYAAPAHGYRTPAGPWVIGLAPATDAAARLDTPGADNPAAPTFACGATNAGDCSTAHWNPSCSDQCCCQEVCAADPFCCQVQWDSICATAAVNCTGDCGGGCQTDLNADGATDGNDLGLLLGAWGPGTSTADFNQDGAVDGNDLGIMLGAWGPCSGG